MYLIYPAIIIMVQCWIPLKKHIVKLNTLITGASGMILGISNRQQWSEQIIKAEARYQWADKDYSQEGQEIKVGMSGASYMYVRLSKSIWLGWMSQPCPVCGHKKHGGM